MSALALALVLGAAVLHTGWNALAKRGGHPLCFLWSAAAVAGLLFTPVAAVPLLADGLPGPARPWVVATSLLHALYFYALGRSYRSGEFSLVYPVARGLGVALVPGLARLLLGETVSPLGVTGIALVVAGIVVLQLGPVAVARAGVAPPGGAGTWWAVATGLTIAAYALVDRVGVTRLHPVPYIWLMFLGACALLVPVVARERAALADEWRRNWPAIAVAGAMTLAAYLLVLFAFRLAKTGYVVAAREVSIVLSVVVGRLWFADRAWPVRLAGAGLILAGVGCVAVAR